MFEAILKRGTLVTIAVLIICTFGILAILRVPIQMIPDLDVRTITVETIWPGATPQDVEKEIVIEQEEYLRNIPSLRRMISEASTGLAEIELEFPFGTDINEALIRTNNALSQVPGYPENVDEPRLFATSFSDNSFMYYRVQPLPGNPNSVDMDFMRDFIDDNVRTRMERVDGVSQVEVRGGAERQIQILIDADSLAQRGITINELRETLRARNQDVTGGDIDSGKRRYLLRTVGRFRSLEEIQNLIISRRGDSITRLKDVAEVRLDHFELRMKAFVNTEPIILLSVRRVTGSNVIDIKNRMTPVIAEINEEILKDAGMQMALTSDDVRYVEAAVVNVWKNLAIGAMLATLVMFLFLRSVSATLVGVVGIPICTIAAFLGLLIAGRTINVVSLAGVAFAIGMTLDNSIVVLESIERESRRGLNRFAAALKGVRRVWPAVLASTMTTVLVFAPILFIEQEAGQLYSDIAVAISASILVSMLVAITVIPSLAARLRLGEKPPRQPVGTFMKRIALALIGWLGHGPIRRGVWVLGTIALTAFILIKLTPPASYLPEGEEAKSFSNMIAPAGYSLSEMMKIGDQINTEFAQHLDDDPAAFERGETEIPALRYFILWAMPQQLRMIAETKDPSHIGALMDAIDERFSSYPGMRAFSSRGSIITSNDGGTRSVNLEISGASLAEIYKTVDAAYRRAFQIFDGPSVNAIPPVLSLGQPLLEVRPRWEYAAEVGLSAEAFGYTISALIDGAFVDEFFLGDDKIDMFLYSNSGTAQNLDDINRLNIYTPTGAVVPINTIAEITETADTEIIRRVDGQRTITLNIIPPQAVALETAVKRVENDIMTFLKDSGDVPSGVNMDISGASDQLEATREALSGNFLISVVLCYLLLVAIFTHWGYPLLIMTTVPLGIAGGIVGLWLMNVIGAQLPVFGLAAIQQPFDMITMMGFLILLGTVVNNPILIVHQTLHNLREEGMSVYEGVQAAMESRLRPIMMSMITTVFGLSPLVFLPGAGSELYRGVGAIVLFGLLFATLVTITFLPTLLVTILKWCERRSATSDQESESEVSQP